MEWTNVKCIAMVKLITIFCASFTSLKSFLNYFFNKGFRKYCSKNMILITKKKKELH